MKSFWAFLFLLSFLIPIPGFGDPEEGKIAEKDAPTETADAWLSLIDNHEYNQSWKETSSILRDQVPKDRWREVISNVRDSLGDVDDRKFWRTHYRDNSPGFPRGEYAVVQYKTNFEEKADAIETIHLRKEDPGIWKVCSYYVR
jgi:Protein of unknown function (DUF4019)